LLGLALVADAVDLRTARVLRVDDRTPPPSSTAWVPTALPDAAPPPAKAARPGAAWYRFDLAGAEVLPVQGRVQQGWVPQGSAPQGLAPQGLALYLPFLYHGGDVWLNGTHIAHIPEGDAQRRVRWERPHLVPLPPGLLRPDANDLAIRAADPPPGTVRRFPVATVGPHAELQAAYDRRFLWVRTMPQITIAVCLLMSTFVAVVWWRRRSEVLYGLFGLASALWGVRTLTFVIEQMSIDRWQWWRIAYLGATGGFVIVLTLFALRSAGIRSRGLQRGLVLYWLAGPLWLLAAGMDAEVPINRIWSAGLIPIAMGMLGVSLWDALRRRTLQAVVLPGAMAIALLAGIHDYLVAWSPDLLARLLPGWVEHRIFLLHMGANIMLVAMGGLLTGRFIQALSSVEDLNRNLEARVAERERELAGNFVAMGELQQRHAAAQERHRVMRDIHDGLGSRLFSTLFRVERGALDQAQVAEALRECIAEMRIALDTLGPDDDFRTSLGNFLFRWQSHMQEGGVASSWTIDMPDDGEPVAPHAALQILRIAQEALTNVLKHAKASAVQVAVRQSARMLELDVADDGHGRTGARHVAGRGLGNMRVRATQLGGYLDVRMSETGTTVSLRIPMPLEGASPTVLN
jgi:signal transduction histidine kinase